METGTAGGGGGGGGGAPYAGPGATCLPYSIDSSLGVCRWDRDDRIWLREGGFIGGVIDLRGAVYCWFGAMEVASDPLDSASPSRMVTLVREGDMVERLDRLCGFFSSEALDLDGLWLVRGDETSFSDLDDLFLGGVSARAVLLDLVSPSFFDRRLDDDLFTSVLILMLAFFFALSDPFSSFSPTALPLREDGRSSPVNGGLGGA